MSVYDDAAHLEGLLPLAISALFRSTEEDPLRHHSVSQVRMIRALSTGSKTATELSRLVNLSPSSLTQMASRLILAGLVSKELDPNDRRVRKLSLTPEGRKMMDRRQAMRAQAATSLLEQLGPEKVETLIRLLESIAELEKDRGAVHLEAVI